MSLQLREVWGALLVSLALGAGHARAAPPSEQARWVAHHDHPQYRHTRARPLGVRARVELGALGLLAHHIRYGDTTRVDYRKDADQDTLSFFARLSAELAVRGRHGLIFVYQPLKLDSQAVIGRDIQVGEVTFPENTLVRFGYGFDFYRLMYQYDVFADAHRELAFGAGFQLRNARVSFVSGDGERAFTETGPGVVPLLRVRARYVFENALFVEGELDGWVSPIPGQGKREGELPLGAVADGALRGGLMLTQHVEAFLTLRYLGGGYRGESSENTPLRGDDWTSNWLHTLIVSLGAGLR
jgi:hypothetical protein